MFLGKLLYIHERWYTLRCEWSDEECDYDTACLRQLVVVVLKSTLSSLGTGISGDKHE